MRCAIKACNKGLSDKGQTSKRVPTDKTILSKLHKALNENLKPGDRICSVCIHIVDCCCTLYLISQKARNSQVSSPSQERGGIINLVSSTNFFMLHNSILGTGK